MMENSIEESLPFVGFKQDFLLTYDLKRDDTKSLGSSNKANVYKAKNLKNGNYYAIKVFKKISKIEQEIFPLIEIFGLLKSSCNDKTINLYQIFIWNDNNETNGINEINIQLVIVTEFCEGGNLDRLFKYKRLNKRKFKVEELDRIAIDLIDTLYNLIHKYKMNHRDIKPSNIFIKEGKIKLGDFDVAKLSEEAQVYYYF